MFGIGRRVVYWTWNESRLRVVSQQELQRWEGRRLNISNQLLLYLSIEDDAECWSFRRSSKTPFISTLQSFQFSSFHITSHLFFYLSSWSCNCCCLQFVLFSSRWWQSEEVEKIFTWKCREINLHRLDISFSFAASRKVFVFCARLREHKSGDDWKSVKVSADIDNILSFILCLSLTLLFEFESAMMMIQMWWKMRNVFRTSWCVSGKI